MGAAARLSGGGHRSLADDDLREWTAEPVFQAEPRRHRDRRAHRSGFLVLEGRSAASGTEPLCEPEQAVGGRVHRGSRRDRHDAGDLRPGGPEHPVGVSGSHSRAARPGPGSVQRDEAVHAPDSPADRAPSPDVQRAEYVVCPARAAGDACRGLEWRERPVVDGLCGPGGGGRRDDASRGPDGRGPPVRGDGRAAGTWSVTGAPVLARVLRRGGGRRAGRRAGLGARRAPRPWPRPHRLGRLVAGHRDAGSRRIGSRGGGGLAAPPATPQAVRGAGTRTMAQTLGNQSDLRGHRLRRGHRRNHRLAADKAGAATCIRARLRCSSRSRP